jgi:hypothetical protein
MSQTALLLLLLLLLTLLLLLQVPNWSRVGRLKRSKFPSLGGGGHTFGGGAGAGLMTVLAGTYAAHAGSTSLQSISQSINTAMLTLLPMSFHEATVSRRVCRKHQMHACAASPV